MDGWMEGWREGWMDGWMDGWMEGGKKFCADRYVAKIQHSIS